MKEHFLDIEEQFHSDDRKEAKKTRKKATAKDRSKYKKTDQPLSEETPPPLNKGEVLGIVMQVLPENSSLVKVKEEVLLCPFKGSLRYEKTQERNILAVGDHVHVQITWGHGGLITYVHPRNSFLYRYENNSIKRQLLACNIDQVFISVSVLMPRIKPHLIDRYIIAAKEGNLTPILLFNKIDLLTSPPPSLSQEEVKQAKSLYKELKALYQSLGILVLSISCETHKGFKELKAAMEGKVSVFSGQSGVGKTSIINHLLGSDFATKEVMTQSHKGAHTTTSSRLIEMGKETYSVDTPGIKSFGVGIIEAQKIHDYFEEIRYHAALCKFARCTHSHEPGCKVKEAVARGEISPLRYLSYCNLMDLSPIEEEEKYESD